MIYFYLSRNRSTMIMEKNDANQAEPGLTSMCIENT